MVNNLYPAYSAVSLLSEFPLQESFKTDEALFEGSVVYIDPADGKAKAVAAGTTLPASPKRLTGIVLSGSKSPFKSGVQDAYSGGNPELGTTVTVGLFDGVAIVNGNGGAELATGIEVCQAVNGTTREIGFSAATTGNLVVGIVLPLSANNPMSPQINIVRVMMVKPYIKP